MKKLVCMALVCLMLLCAASALAAGNTINVSIEVPESLDMSAELLAKEIPVESISAPAGVTVVGLYGWAGDKEEPHEPGSTSTPVNFDGVDYWGWNECYPKAGVEYAFAMQLEVTPAETQIDNITVNGKSCPWVQMDTGLYVVLCTVGTLQADGTLLTEPEVPETGDATPIALLVSMLVVSAAGIVVLSKRRRCN